VEVIAPDPSEWANPFPLLSEPPLVNSVTPSLRHTHRSPPVFVTEFPGSEIRSSVGLQYQRQDLISAQTRLQRELIKTRTGVKSAWLGIAPTMLGTAVAATYDAFQGDAEGVVKGVGQEAAEKLGEKYLNDAAEHLTGAVPLVGSILDALSLHKAQRAHGLNVEKMKDLEKKVYIIDLNLKSPEAYYEINPTWQQGPNNRLLHRGKPIPRIQTHQE
jgi:hypothetical protein